MTSVSVAVSEPMQVHRLTDHSVLSLLAPRRPQPNINTALALKPTALPTSSLTDANVTGHDFTVTSACTGEPESVESEGRIRLELDSAELWNSFYSLSTEMVITKSGRRMFPALRLHATGLKPAVNYVLMMDIVAVDCYRYKYQDSRWVVAGKADSTLNSNCRQLYVHPDSPATGQHWMARTVSFHKLKLTNNVACTKTGHMILNSMHRYQPRFYVIESRDLSNLATCPVEMFAFPETQFIAVTAYQNDKITQLKIDNNPFAKGFRESGAAKSHDKKRQVSKLLSRDTSPDVMSSSSIDDVRRSHDVTDDVDNNSNLQQEELQVDALSQVEDQVKYQTSCDQQWMDSSSWLLPPSVLPTAPAATTAAYFMASLLYKHYNMTSSPSHRSPVRFSPYVITSDVSRKSGANMTSHSINS